MLLCTIARNCNKNTVYFLSYAHKAQSNLSWHGIKWNTSQQRPKWPPKNVKSLLVWLLSRFELTLRSKLIMPFEPTWKTELEKMVSEVLVTLAFVKLCLSCASVQTVVSCDLWFLWLTVWKEERYYHGLKLQDLPKNGLHHGVARWVPT